MNKWLTDLAAANEMIAATMGMILKAEGCFVARDSHEISELIDCVYTAAQDLESYVAQSLQVGHENVEN